MKAVCERVRVEFFVGYILLHLLYCSENTLELARVGMYCFVEFLGSPVFALKDCGVTLPGSAGQV